MPSSQPENRLDNDNEAERLVKFISTLSPWNLERGVIALDEYTQSKLKAFAGEVEKAIGEDNGCGFCGDQLQTELRGSLKAIKEKYQL